MLRHPNESSDSVTSKDLEALRNANPPREERVDIRSITLDMDAPAEVRAQQLLEQVKNPYAVMCGDLAVNIGFTPDGKTLRDAMTSYLSAQRK